jgi:hypothetical protein
MNISREECDELEMNRNLNRLGSLLVHLPNFIVALSVLVFDVFFTNEILGNVNPLLLPTVLPKVLKLERWVKDYIEFM